MNLRNALPQLFHPSLLVQEAFSMPIPFFPMFSQCSENHRQYLACAMVLDEFRSWPSAVTISTTCYCNKRLGLPKWLEKRYNEHVLCLQHSS